MGDHEALLKAIREGGDVDKPDGTSMRPLHWAAKCGRPDDLRALLAAGAAVDAVNKAGVTALIYAASTGQDDCVPVLLKAGASPGKGRRKVGLIPGRWRCRDRAGRRQTIPPARSHGMVLGVVAT